MYSEVNFKTKKAFKEAVAAGRKIGVFQAGGMFNTLPQKEGTCSVEGPHYPAPHTWYATVTLENGIVTKVR